VAKTSTSTLEYVEKSADFKRLGISRRFALNAKDVNIQKGASENFSFEIEGYASTTGKDRQDDIITHEAILNSKDDLLQKGSSTVLFNHDSKMPIGRVLSTRVNSKGLIIRVGISNADDVKSIRTKIKERILTSFSIGGRFKRVQVERDEDGRITSFKVLEMELFEVSVVSVPANAEADIFEVVEKMFNPKKEREMSKKEEVEIVAVVPPVTKKEDMAPAVSPLTKEDVTKMIGESAAPILEAIKTLTEKMVAPPVTPPVVPPVAPSVEIPQWAKDLTEKIDKLSLVPARKGLVGEETEVEEEKEETVSVEKSLVSSDDEKSVKFVKHVMDNEGAFNALSKEEQAIAKSIYLTLLQKKVTKKEN
jgi:HK97 family phage prohead protease